VADMGGEEPVPLPSGVCCMRESTVVMGPPLVPSWSKLEWSNSSVPIGVDGAPEIGGDEPEPRSIILSAVVAKL